LLSAILIGGFWILQSCEAKEFVKEGHLVIDGQLPTITHGGLIGEGYIHGLKSFSEGVGQTRSTAVNQVKDVENAIVTSGCSAAILSRVLMLERVECARSGCFRYDMRQLPISSGKPS
jgi:hypothetical protein